MVGSELGDSDLWGGRIHRPHRRPLDVDPAQLHKNCLADHVLLGDAAVRPRLCWRRCLRGPTPRAGGGAARGLPEGGAGRRRPVRRDPRPPCGPRCRPTEGGRRRQLAGHLLRHRALLRPPAPRAFCYTPGFATLGYGLPAAIGAEVAEPDRPVVVLLGDGALMFSVQELVTASSRAADPGRRRRQRRLRRDPRPAARPRHPAERGSTCATPDLAALARAMGAHGGRGGPPGRDVADARRRPRSPPTGRPSSTSISAERNRLAWTSYRPLYLVGMIAFGFWGKRRAHNSIRLPRRRPPLGPLLLLRHDGRRRAWRRLHDRRCRARLQVRVLGHVAGGRHRRRHPAALAGVRGPDPAAARLHGRPDAGAALRARLERALRRGDVGLHADARR